MRSSYLRDAVGLVGLALLSWGAYLVYAPLGAIVPGAVLCLVVFVGARRQ